MARNKEALVVTNITREQPGTYLDILQKRGWQANVINLDQGQIFPSPTIYGALIVMGGPPSANDASEITPWMPTEITRIQEALSEGVPFLGTCLGMQALVKAAGGQVIPSPVQEVGFREKYGEPPGKFYSVRLTESGRADPLFEGLSETLSVFHLHGETVVLPSQAKLLGSSNAVPNQIVKVGEHAYGTQGHFELTPEMLESWLSVDPDLLNLGSKGIEQVRKDFAKLQREYTKTATTLFGNFLDIASS